MALVKFQISIEMGDILPIVRLNKRGDTLFVDTALEMIDIELLYSLGNCMVIY